MRRALLSWLPLVLLPCPTAAQDGAARDDSFVRSVAPALEEHCVRCHGPERQRRGLRLDSLVALRHGGQSGPAIVAGDPESSLLMRHVEGRNAKRMPPEGPPLDSGTIADLRAWIAGGCRGDDGKTIDPAELGHWAYRPIRRWSPPHISGADTPIDAFLLAKLAPLTDHFAPEADDATLTRRVWLDVVGLPPSDAEIEVVRSEHRDAAHAGDWYERLVDRALASPHFGERWAAWWLDLARYADTKGYEKDARRTIWRWRDWVIDAFDRDLPFDQFTIRQLAGDLLPDASDDDVLATAFHRNTMTNDEGGTDDEEFRVAAVIDRVNTTMEVWMGSTVGCAQCHDHKYDPIAQRDYYGLFAYFNQTADADREDEAPTMAAPTPEWKAEIDRLQAMRSKVAAELAAPVSADVLRDYEQEILGRAHARDAMAAKYGPWRYAGPFQGESFDDAYSRIFGPESPQTSDVHWTPRPDWKDGVVHTDLAGSNVAHYLERTVRTEAAGELTLSLGSDDAIVLTVGDRIVLEKKVSRAAAPDQEIVRVRVPAGETRILLKIVNGGGPAGFYFRDTGDGVDPDLRAAVQTPQAQRTAAQIARIEAGWRATAPALTAVRESIRSLDQRIAAIPAPAIPVMRELPADAQRVTHLFVRGSFLSPGEEVTPDVPSRIFPIKPEYPRNRLGLAQWIVDKDNPLTARVLVNRIWEQVFGIGLVETTEEFGQQGEPPSHPKLLDWLATDLVEHGWSIKHLLRTILCTQAYRQSSAVRADLAEADPYDRLLGHAPAVRLSAEAVRDCALSAAGLLSEKKFGPSVMPYQPEGVWQVVYSGDAWRTSEGGDQYRRGLYTFWRRTSPYPSMTTFDAPSREFCVMKRSRTNTPIQALVTLNDPAFFECARQLARLAQDGCKENDEHYPQAIVRLMFHRCTSRDPDPDELARLLQLFLDTEDELARGSAHDIETLHGLRLVEGAGRAALVVVANTILNLDECLVKR
ncbi:MAG: PSD1 and planctomycete cytochrome C domain-containing protein [Planctomycetota bacterium]